MITLNMIVIITINILSVTVILEISNGVAWKTRFKNFKSTRGRQLWRC